MINEQNNMTINLLGKKYMIKCPADKIADLQASALFLDKKMREVRDTGKIVGIDRVAVIAALNITHELLVEQKKKSGCSFKIAEKFDTLSKKIERALAATENDN